ncbi:hypothetical protein [Portibacter lacus]|uniref:Lipoprotein n=1 Tax=Portibacter lacus TaxID=1099794 RepID=A0AA37SLW3_9BACT|nr:hypothetical protein [Portibacter lacus]GLR15817.1 hypothetical protein GCM10007940_04320 [Portibacter lacus]
MRILTWLCISIFFTASCNSQTTAPSTSAVETSKKENPLSVKIESFYKLFDVLPDKEMTCDDLMSKTSLGKDAVIEYISTDVRDWTEDEWSEISFNAVMAEKKDNYYLIVVEKEGPRNSQIYFNTYDQYGMRNSSILVCEDGPNGDIKSRIGKDRSIFRMGDDGVATYKLNARGVYVKGQ